MFEMFEAISSFVNTQSFHANSSSWHEKLNTKKTTYAKVVALRNLKEHDYICEINQILCYVSDACETLLGFVLVHSAYARR